MRQETDHTALQEAIRLLEQKSDAPADLVSLLLARLTPDDVRLFDGESFAIIAEGAWQALNEPRPGGSTTIRLDDRQLRMAGHVRDVTLL